MYLERGGGSDWSISGGWRAGWMEGRREGGREGCVMEIAVVECSNFVN